jgi:hypothetical protein
MARRKGSKNRHQPSPNERYTRLLDQWGFGSIRKPHLSKAAYRQLIARIAKAEKALRNDHGCQLREHLEAHPEDATASMLDLLRQLER